MKIINIPFIPSLDKMDDKSLENAIETSGAKAFSWNPVCTPSPDFHRPEFFGEIRF